MKRMSLATTRFELVTGITRRPCGSAIFWFRHMLEERGLGQQILNAANAKLTDHGPMLKTGVVVDATLIAAPQLDQERQERTRPRKQAK